MISRTATAALVLMAAATVAAPSYGASGSANAEDSTMPVITPVEGGTVAHDARRQLTISYAGATYGWYHLEVTCDAGPEVPQRSWTRLQRWKGGDAEGTQWFHAAGGLPPGANCAATLSREEDGATLTRTFDVVWGDEPIYLHEMPDELWPVEEDGGQTLSIVVDLKEPGNYATYVRSQNGFYREHDLGDVAPGRYTWEWDGRRTNGAIASEGRYSVEVDGWTDGGYSDYVFKYRNFLLKHGTETKTVSDRRHERGSRHVDISSFTLSNGPKKVELTYRFRKLDRSALEHISAGLDVDHLDKGYLLNVRRIREGALRGRLSLGYLASDQGQPTRIRCGGLDVSVRADTAELTIPRVCLSRGGHDMRAYYGAGDSHYHYDWGPDRSSREYFTPWVTYEDPPKS